MSQNYELFAAIAFENSAAPPSRSAAKTFEEPFGWVDHERVSGIIVKRTIASPHFVILLEFNIGKDQFYKFS
jgi:hypothetical protein